MKKYKLISVLVFMIVASLTEGQEKTSSSYSRTYSSSSSNKANTQYLDHQLPDLQSSNGIGTVVGSSSTYPLNIPSTCWGENCNNNLCPNGQQYVNGRCVSLSPQCPGGFIFRDGVCVSISDLHTRYTGGSTCKLVCQAEFHSQDLLPAIKEVPICPYNNRECQYETCPEGSVLIEKNCYSCPSGYFLNSRRECEKYKACCSSSSMVNGNCQPSCPASTPCPTYPPVVNCPFSSPPPPPPPAPIQSVACPSCPNCQVCPTPSPPPPPPPVCPSCPNCQVCPSPSPPPVCPSCPNCQVCPSPPPTIIYPCPVGCTRDCPTCPCICTITAPTPRPAEIFSCPPGSYRDGEKCVRISCPSNTTWDGLRCFSSPTMHSNVNLTHIVSNYNNISQPVNVEVRNENTVYIHGTDGTVVSVNGSHTSNPPTNCGTSCPSVVHPAPPVPTQTQNSCCTVVTPRICRQGPRRWLCHNRRYTQCGSFCRNKKIYLTPPSPVYRPPVLVMPPLCTGDGECANRGEGRNCSDCISGGDCPSYCHESNCSGDDCAYYDQKEYCNDNPTHIGCTADDGCYDDYCL